MAVYIGTLVIVLGTFIFYAITIYHLYIDMHTNYHNFLKNTDLLYHFAWFLGIAMAACAFAILISFLFMYRALK